MASFQILDLPFEEDLSYEQAMSIGGGQETTTDDGGVRDFVNDVLIYAESLVQQGLLTADQALDAAYGYLLDVGAACQGSDDVDACFASYGLV